VRFFCLVFPGKNALFAKTSARNGPLGVRDHRFSSEICDFEVEKSATSKRASKGLAGASGYQKNSPLLDRFIRKQTPYLAPNRVLYWKDGAPARAFGPGSRLLWFSRDPAWENVLGKNDVEKGVGEWNTLVVTMKSDTMAVRLNGVTVSQAADLGVTRGKLQIQSEGSEVLSKRIILQPLGDGPNSNHHREGLPACRSSR
jgi:hypothetical protein